MGRGRIEQGVKHITKEQYDRAVKNDMFLTQEDFNAVLGVGRCQSNQVYKVQTNEGIDYYVPWIEWFDDYE